MDLDYDLQIGNDFKTLNIVVDNDNANPIQVSIDDNTNLIEEIENLPLLKTDNNVMIKFSEVYNNNYNSVELYDKVWSVNDNITLNGNKLTGSKLFEKLKSNVSKLYKLLKDEDKFKPAMNVYLKPLANTGELNNGQYFPSLLAKRHMLYKITTLLYISFTVAETTMCKTEESQALDYQKAKQRYNGLLKLVGDTTNLLLNIDVINKNPSLPVNANPNAMLRVPSVIN